MSKLWQVINPQLKLCGRVGEEVGYFDKARHGGAYDKVLLRFEGSLKPTWFRTQNAKRIDAQISRETSGNPA